MNGQNDRSRRVDPAATVVAYDRQTCEGISLHHFAAVEDVPLPAENELHEIALRHAMLDRPRDETAIGILSVEPQQLEPGKAYRVSVDEAVLVEVTTEG